MMTLIRNADCFAPDPLGVQDILLGGEQICALGAPGTLRIDGVEAEIIDAEGRRAIPGFIDPLTHPCGGGGEGGFGNRTRELEAEALIRAGVTSPIGALGTDSVTRSLEVLYGKTMQLRAQGLNAWMYSGSYRIPAPTLTGDVVRDLVLIAPVIGMGEVAIADHRSSQPTAGELQRLAAEVALGGTISGKGGTVFIHVGDADEGLSLINAVLDESTLSPALFMATHVNRSYSLLAQAAELTRRGGVVDITVSTTPELIAAGDIPAEAALSALLKEGADVQKITLSSDAGGSLPHYVNGALHGITTAGPNVFLPLLARASQDGDTAFCRLLSCMTENTAMALGLDRQGRIEPGRFGDLVLLDESLSRPTHVFCRGRNLLAGTGTRHPNPN